MNVARALAIGNHKGGVGKTTITLATGAELARRGRRVLLVDLDPQAALTAAAGIDAAAQSLAEVIGGALPGRARLAEVIRPIAEGLDLAPSDQSLAVSELGLVGRLGRERVIARAVAEVAGAYDLILFDLPPSLGLLAVAGLVAAHGVLVPTAARALDLRAVRAYLATVDAIRVELNPGLRVIGIVPTFYDGRRRHDAEALEVMRAGGLPVWEPVPGSVKVAEAAAAGVDAIGYAGPGNPAAAALVKIAEGVGTWLNSGQR
jgi:chromosome partitioning protein